ncbi:GNAT family acetyltransferase [Acinetobacter sp. TGL-Y2]|uniref:GNAT family N-acetyltransferase n=1 Tax=Acinetobacter sp. TGL-Y2 TaxID=1407071 RepID=UPI0007A68175|nr:GNAT family N-acetyltransferase [Acinetobacter sp. TGL-Y2]AMW77975.1 GNAT family acetyltransferase [Acinetobacter sp. TGL-Y2]
MSKFNIVSADWATLKQDAQYIRELVFIQEQQIDAIDEWDAQDPISLHFVVYGDLKPIATARLLDNNSIGRVAVLKEYRGQGIGKILMLDIIQQAKIQKRETLKLSAQVHAIAFYQRLGFKAEGAEYLDCGIPHRDMTLIF